MAGIVFLCDGVRGSVFGVAAVGASSTRMVLAHLAMRGSRVSIVIPAYLMNICWLLRRRHGS